MENMENGKSYLKLSEYDLYFKIGRRFGTENMENDKNCYVEVSEYDLYFKKGISFWALYLFTIKLFLYTSFTKKIPVNGKKIETQSNESNRSGLGVAGDNFIKSFIRHIFVLDNKYKDLNEESRIEINADKIFFYRGVFIVLILGIISLACGVIFLCLDILFKLALAMTLCGSIFFLGLLLLAALHTSLLQHQISTENGLKSSSLTIEKIHKGFSLEDSIIPVSKIVKDQIV